MNYGKPTEPEAPAGEKIAASAEISPCGTYRYYLDRIWNTELSNACFFMLNPSVADAMKDDPTIRKCVGFARKWGCGGIEVVNLFAYRATDPAALKTATVNPAGPLNAGYIRRSVERCQPVVAAWGTHGELFDAERAARELLESLAVSVQCLGTTKAGKPKHPLYVPYESPLAHYLGPDL